MIATYDDLAATVSDWLDRDDLAKRVPDFIALAEARINRVLDDPEMEAHATTDGEPELALPEDFGRLIAVTAGYGPITYIAPSSFGRLNLHGQFPRYYTQLGSTLFLHPGRGPVSIVYSRRLPPLGAVNATNWLLDLAPDVYLYGALVQASAFLAEDERVGMWKAAFDEALAEMKADALKRRYGPGPLAPRIARP